MFNLISIKKLDLNHFSASKLYKKKKQTFSIQNVISNRNDNFQLLFFLKSYIINSSHPFFEKNLLKQTITPLLAKNTFKVNTKTNENIQSQSNNNIIKNENKCGKNQKLTKNGECECLDDYLLNDENNECYKCEHLCHPNASCYYPGKCSCNRGFFGDGIIECYKPIPEIIDIDPKEGPIMGGINITITLPIIPKKYSSIFCRFGDSTVISYPLQKYNYDKHQIICQLPSHIEAKTSVSISYDQHLWSKDVTFTYKDQNEILFKVIYENWFLLLIGVILLIIYILLNYMFNNYLVKRSKEFSLNSNNNSLSNINEETISFLPKNETHISMDATLEINNGSNNNYDILSDDLSPTILFKKRENPIDI